VRLRVRIPAKINLHLQVLGTRPDGYHELRTLLQSVDLFDELVAEEAPEGTLELSVEPPGEVTDGDDNLVLRAARSLRRISGRQCGARIELSKRIPVGGGLGGGSADAAAALVLLDRLWSLGLDGLTLYETAAGLGSDVPFFLEGGLALGVGRGDEVYPLPDIGPLGVIVATPGIQIVTADVYRRIPPRLTWARHADTVYAFSAGLAQRLRWETMVNDLEPVVLAGWQGLDELLAELKQTKPLRAAVSGSGSAVFAVYGDRESACRAGSGLCHSSWTHVGQTLVRDRARPVVQPEGSQS
jgi:4-diphosphocytidyl-2-C-methyl-D-erythritol kinase